MTLQIPGTDKEKDELITDMYEALKRLVKETRPYAYQGMLDEAEQALSKARGEVIE